MGITHSFSAPRKVNALFSSYSQYSTPFVVKKVLILFFEAINSYTEGEICLVRKSKNVTKFAF